MSPNVTKSVLEGRVLCPYLANAALRAFAHALLLSEIKCWPTKKYIWVKTPSSRSTTCPDGQAFCASQGLCVSENRWFNTKTFLGFDLQIPQVFKILLRRCSEYRERSESWILLPKKDNTCPWRGPSWLQQCTQGDREKCGTPCHICLPHSWHDTQVSSIISYPTQTRCHPLGKLRWTWTCQVLTLVLQQLVWATGGSWSPARGSTSPYTTQTSTTQPGLRTASRWICKF